MYKPDGWPYLVVEGAARPIECLQRVFWADAGGTTWWIATKVE
jgi:hypothetical protein